MCRCPASEPHYLDSELDGFPQRSSTPESERGRILNIKLDQIGKICPPPYRPLVASDKSNWEVSAEYTLAGSL